MLFLCYDVVRLLKCQHFSIYYFFIEPEVALEILMSNHKRLLLLGCSIKITNKHCFFVCTVRLQHTRS